MHCAYEISRYVTSRYVTWFHSIRSHHHDSSAELKYLCGWCGWCVYVRRCLSNSTRTIQLFVNGRKEAGRIDARPPSPSAAAAAATTTTTTSTPSQSTKYQCFCYELGKFGDYGMKLHDLHQHHHHQQQQHHHHQHDHHHPHHLIRIRSFLRLCEHWCNHTWMTD